MYTIFCDDVCIYDDRSPLPDLQLDEPVLTLEENTAGSLEFKMDVGSMAYNHVKAMRSKIVVKKDDKEIFWGRALSIEKDFFNRQKVYCEGALSYLNDTYQMQTEYKNILLSDFVKAVLKQHNNKVEDYKKFYLGIFELDNVSPDDGNDNLEPTAIFKNARAVDDTFFEEDPDQNPGDDILEEDPDQNPGTDIEEEDPTNPVDPDFKEDPDQDFDPNNPEFGDGSLEEDPDQTPGTDIEEEDPINPNPPSNPTNPDNPGTGDTPTNPDILADRYTAFEKTITSISDLVDDYHARLVLRKSGGKFYLDFLKKTTRNRCNQKIQFGENLLDFTSNYDMSSLCTVLLPLGSVIEKESNTIGKALNLKFQPAGRRLISNNNVVGISRVDNNNLALPITYLISNYISVKGGERYYYSGRMNSGYGMYAICDDKNTTYMIKKAGDEEGYTDVKNELITIPAGATRLFVAGTDTGDFPIEIHTYNEIVNQLDDYVNVTSVNNGNIYVQNDYSVSVYGHIEKQKVWPKVKEPKELLQKARLFMRDHQFDEMTIKITALDLHLLNPELDDISLGDEIYCVSKPHGLDRLFPVNKITIPLDQLDNQLFYLNYDSRETQLTSVTNVTTSEIYDKIAERPSTTSILTAAYHQASEIMNDSRNGFVVYDKDETLWMNSPDKTKATSVWRFNVNGLAYASGEGAYYMRENAMHVALTRDGQIVADMITTGHMKADRIYGGTLTLGGLNNQNGVMQMLANDGTRFGYWGSGELLIGSRTPTGHSWKPADGDIFADANIYSDTKTFGTQFRNGVMVHYFDGWVKSWIGTNEWTGESNSAGEPDVRLGIGAVNCMAIATPKLYMCDSYVGPYNELMKVNGNIYKGYTGMVRAVFKMENGQYYYNDLRFINGLLCCWNPYPLDTDYTFN